MRLPRYQFLGGMRGWQPSKKKKKKDGKKAPPAKVISPTIQGCLITSTLDNKRELIHMLMEAGQTNCLTVWGGVVKVKKTSVFFSPHFPSKSKGQQISGRKRVADFGVAGRKSIQWNSGILMRQEALRAHWNHASVLLKCSLKTKV